MIKYRYFFFGVEKNRRVNYIGVFEEVCEVFYFLKMYEILRKD